MSDMDFCVLDTAKKACGVQEDLEAWEALTLAASKIPSISLNSFSMVEALAQSLLGVEQLKGAMNAQTSYLNSMKQSLVPGTASPACSIQTIPVKYKHVV